MKNLFDIRRAEPPLADERGWIANRSWKNDHHNTPFDRFGQADQLHGALHYLLTDASQFVTGTVSVVDGRFIAFSGV